MSRRENLVSRAQHYLEAFLEDEDDDGNLWLPRYRFIGDDYERDYGHLFEMLQRYPELAGERFGNAFPLVYMAAAAAPLFLISQVYKMNPDVWHDRRHGQVDCPLREAIAFNCSTEVIQFLVDRCPDDVYEKFDPADRTPMEKLLTFRGQIDDFWEKAQILGNANPKSVAACIDDNISLLNLAIRRQQTPSCFMHWLGQQLSKEHQSAIYNDWRGRGRRLGTQENTKLMEFLDALDVNENVRFVFQFEESELDDQFLDWYVSCNLHLPRMELHIERCELLGIRQVQKLLGCARLEILRVEGSEADVDEMAAFIEEQDTTPRLDFVVGGQENEKLQYLSLLTRHGSAKLRSLHATRDLLVDSLMSIKSDDLAPPCLESSLSFGFLREAPALWTEDCETISFSEVPIFHPSKHRKIVH